MTEQQLKNILFKISIIAIHKLSAGTKDPIALQESIERNSYTRPIVFSTQIIHINDISDTEKEITFVLSPDFLTENRSLVLKGGLHELTWMYKTLDYDYGDEEVVMEDAEGIISMQHEEGLANWLTRGTIEIIKINKYTYELDLKTLFHSVMSMNGD